VALETKSDTLMIKKLQLHSHHNKQTLPAFLVFKCSASRLLSSSLPFIRVSLINNNNNNNNNNNIAFCPKQVGVG
jgi:hypothetical protein